MAKRLVVETAFDLFAVAESPAGMIVDRPKGTRGIVTLHDPDRNGGAGAALVAFPAPIKPFAQATVWLPWDQLSVVGKVDIGDNSGVVL